MPAIRSHSTGTSDRPWSAATNERRVRSEESESYYAKIYAWRDPDSGEKSAHKFIHHFIGTDGDPGEASTRACSAAIAVLNGGRGGTTIPDADRQGVYNHVAKHLRDAGKEVPELKNLEPETNGLDWKSVEFKIDALNEDGTFTGYASVFNNVDEGGDMVLPGAFRKTLSDREGKVPLFRSHRFPIGMAYLEEDEAGLKVTKGILNLQKQLGRDAYSDLKFYADHELPMGMSFGYKAIASQTKRENGVRKLGEVKLYEVTIDELPMNEAARVGAVKSRKGSFSEEFDKIRTLRSVQDAIYALEESVWSTVWSEDSAEDKEATLSDSISEFHDTLIGLLPSWLGLLGMKEVFEEFVKSIRFPRNMDLDALLERVEERLKALPETIDDTGAKVTAVPIVEEAAVEPGLPLDREQFVGFLAKLKA